MEFTLLGKTIEISQGRQNYMKILSYYKDMAKQAEKDFKREYEEIFGLVFLNSTWAEKFNKTYGSDDYMDNIVKKYVAKTRQYLANYGVYTLSDSTIWDDGIITDDRSVSLLQYEFNSFLLECIDREENDEIFISRLKSKFEGSFFPKCLYNDVMSLCDFVLSYLDDNGIAEIQFVYKNEAEQAEALYSNLKDTIFTHEDELELFSSISMELSEEDFLAEVNKRMPPQISEESKAEMAQRLIELDPRNSTYHRYIFEHLPQAKYEIAAIAKYLNIDLSDLIDNEIKSKFDLKSISCEEDALKMMDDLKASMEKFEITTSPRIAELQKILADYDVKARTYDGILYSTRELSAKAENDDKEIAAIYTKRDIATKSECLEIIELIDSKTCDESIKNKHTSILNNKIQQIEKCEMEAIISGVETAEETECNVYMASITDYDATVALKDPYITRINNRLHIIWREELSIITQGVATMSEDECNSVKEKLCAHRAPESLKANHLNDIEKRLQSIWEAEDLERFTEIFLSTRMSDTTQIEENKKLVKETGRTQYVRDRFTVAFAHLNPTDVEAAAKYAVAKESGMIASIINHGKKDVYEFLSLGDKVMHPDVIEAKETVKAKKGNGILLSLGFGKNKSQQAAQPQNSAGAKFCPECGTKTDGVSKFCSNCGNKLH